MSGQSFIEELSVNPPLSEASRRHRELLRNRRHQRNRRHVFFPLALVDAYRARVRQDQTPISRITPISQKPSARLSCTARGRTDCVAEYAEPRLTARTQNTQMGQRVARRPALSRERILS